MEEAATGDPMKFSKLAHTPPRNGGIAGCLTELLTVWYNNNNSFFVYRAPYIVHSAVHVTGADMPY